MYAAEMRKLVCFMIVVGCGGATATTTTPPNDTTDAAAPVTSASTAASSTPTQDAGASGDAQREMFMALCMTQMPAREYCGCAYDQFTALVQPGGTLQSLDVTQLATLKQKTLTTCGPKLTDDDVKKGYLALCNGTDTRNGAYCDCTYASLRKTLSPADFISDFEGARFDTARKSTATACKGKLPEAAGKADFINLCTKSRPGQDKTCECVWTKLRSKASAEEIVGGVVDIKATPNLLDSCKPSTK